MEVNLEEVYLVIEPIIDNRARLLLLSMNQPLH